eukprot:c7827_g1_i1.p1 GENE.c7827_g1_i1~~c7827_g1_i1.p1  ORF type:complete len:501 (-),score=95.28 c7827_g1_i1:164-1666(-)
MDDSYYQGSHAVSDPSLVDITERIRLASTEKHLLVMVGLPARGKSYISRKIEMFLNWKGVGAKLFNVGKMRRAQAKEPSAHDASFFSADNPTGRQMREEAAMKVLMSILDWFEDSGGHIAILDATNSTKERRRTIERVCQSHDSNIRVTYIEIICTDQKVLEYNMTQKIQNSPDFADKPFEVALNDLKQRIANYQKVYETLDDDDQSYIKLMDMQTKIHASRIYGDLSRHVLPYIMALHVHPRPIYLIRSGQSVLESPDTTSSIAELNQEGQEFSSKFAEFISNLHTDFKVLTSTLPRALQTASFLHQPCFATPMLNPLDRGAASSLTSEQLQDSFPNFYQQWSNDRLRMRFPGGESYHDLIQRLEPIVVELEASVIPVVVISHISTLQVLYSYFHGFPVENCSQLDIPMHQVIKLVPTVGGALNEERLSIINSPIITSGAHPVSRRRLGSVSHFSYNILRPPPMDNSMMQSPVTIARRSERVPSFVLARDGPQYDSSTD